ncbi:hypothetical protein PF008_g28724 [Phytophthora fragariae]|uniref:Uncharacterized protein n=1 Tax=Phytophthora fragariae TaxID=53985 RepID=A0A6G0QB10_9STRA|nr:hypothetical protein PF008_g28724 [Phytophthora fragariae]
MGCMAAVVFGGRNSSHTLLIATAGALCDGALSTRSRILCPAAMSVLSCSSHWRNTTVVIQPLQVPTYSRPAGMACSQRGRLAVPRIVNGSLWVPDALAATTIVTRALRCLRAGAARRHSERRGSAL